MKTGKAGKGRCREGGRKCEVSGGRGKTSLGEVKERGGMMSALRKR